LFDIVLIDERKNEEESNLGYIKFIQSEKDVVNDWERILNSDVSSYYEMRGMVFTFYKKYISHFESSYPQWLCEIIFREINEADDFFY